MSNCIGRGNLNPLLLFRSLWCSFEAESPIPTSFHYVPNPESNPVDQCQISSFFQPEIIPGQAESCEMDSSRTVVAVSNTTLVAIASAFLFLLPMSVERTWFQLPVTSILADFGIGAATFIYLSSRRMHHRGQSASLTFCESTMFVPLTVFQLFSVYRRTA